MVEKIKKRDGRIVEFVPEKIGNAIFKAAESVGGSDKEKSHELANKVIELLDRDFKDDTPDIENISDAIEKVLIEEGHAKTAKAFILYRQKRKQIRDTKESILGMKLDENTNLSINALKVLERRYLLKDQNQRIIETPNQLFMRVARNIAQADRLYGSTVYETEIKFYNMLKNLEFLPNTPTLMNAGNELQQLSACFVLPVEDSMEGIFDAIKEAAIIHKSGGGTGFSFSRLRPSNDMVLSTKGVASGPVSFMKVFDAATEIIKQGGKRRGANMGVLRVDHPDIKQFIAAKADGKTLQNFNISVGLTNKFMNALKTNTNYELYNPRTGDVLGEYPAKEIFDSIVSNAWKKGDPGILFIDRINESNPLKHIAEIEATNPCGEQPLMPYESCNLGSINLNSVVKDGKMDWEKLKTIIHDAVHFLDNVIDMNKYPLPQIERMSKSTRKIGLGIMGFADVLYQMNIPYDSEEGCKKGEEIMEFIYQEANKKSMELAEKRGVFAYWKGSDLEKQGIPRRNANIITIAPTGTLSMIADASGGLEPNFAICYIKNVMDGTELVYANKYFEKVARDRGFYSESLMKDIAKRGSIQTVELIPDDVKKVFVTAQDISPEWHIRMQAAFQKHVDNAISKTINFPSNCTMQEVEQGYMLAWELGCKGVTVYRDGSIENQVMNIHTVNKTEKKVEPKEEERCPECKGKLVMTEGCKTCPACSYSVCSH